MPTLRIMINMDNDSGNSEEKIIASQQLLRYAVSVLEGYADTCVLKEDVRGCFSGVWLTLPRPVLRMPIIARSNGNPG
jgi:hypothetical protein